MCTFLSVQIWFKTKNWSWCSMNNNDADVKYVEIKLSFIKFSVSCSTGAITILVYNIFKNLQILVTVLCFFCGIWDKVGLKAANFAQVWWCVSTNSHELLSSYPSQILKYFVEPTGGTIPAHQLSCKMGFFYFLDWPNNRV